MKRVITLLITLGLIYSILTITGCTSRRIIGADDHLTRPIMNFETFKTTHYLLFPGSAVHEFWTCEERGDVISCERACDGNTDVSCPTGLMNLTTNVR
ncbi:MAG: hypothetical protein N2746_00815 [Deltaproteobacteria bacterium]|nr:hypothetical protein [Deltaproteobacteria bacterium]